MKTNLMVLFSVGIIILLSLALWQQAEWNKELKKENAEQCKPYVDAINRYIQSNPMESIRGNLTLVLPNGSG